MNNCMCRNLSGIWDFGFCENTFDEFSLRGITYTDFAPVPGCFDLHPAFRQRRGVGVYRLRLSDIAPGSWRLRLGGLGLRGRVFFDGEEIHSTVYPFSDEEVIFTVAPRDEHELVIAVDNRFETSSSALFHEFYDFYAHGGIYRGVEMELLPELWISRLEVTTLDILRNTVKIRIELSGGVPAGEVPLLLDFDDGRCRVAVQVTAGTGEFKVELPGFELWSPEVPALHRLRCRIASGAERETAFGIRRIDIRDGKLLLNDRELKLIGFNRHDSHPDFGYAIPESLQLRDLQLLKSSGANFLRGSHYPQSETLLSWCDRLGILVWEETLGWGNTAEQLNDAEFQARQFEQVRRLCRKSMNHPSVIIHGFLNEAATDLPGVEKFIGELAALYRREDSSRPVAFASNRLQRDRCLELVDIIAFNTYPGWYSANTGEFFDREAFQEVLLQLAEFADSPQLANKPLLISEIGAAALRGETGGMRWSEEYQAELIKTVLEFVDEHPRYSGVALWQFCDCRTYCRNQAFVRPRGFNNKGLLDEYRRPKLAWKTLVDMLKRSDLQT